jgi:hypothetical protein
MSTHLLCDTMWMKTFLVVTFNFFQWRGMIVGSFMAYHPTQEEETSAFLYMYSNMDEMEQYFM